MYGEEPEVKRIIDTAVGVEGLTRGTGVHAAGVILSSEPLLDVLPLARPKADGPVVTGFPFTQAEEMGLLKMDFLGLRNLTVIHDTIAGVKANKGIDIDISEIPLDDATTYELLARADTLGVFQLDGSGMRVLLKMMRPTGFTDIAAVNALYRPGPMEMNAHTNYALRKTGKQKVEPIHPELKDALEPILGDTYHLVVFQEQVMAIAQQLAGYSLGGADMLRRAMGKKKKEVLDAEWGKFSAGMRERGFSDEAVKAVWDVLVPFSGYGFNKSHTAGYGLVSYWTAYLKANHPAEFLAALLTSVGDDKDKMAVYLSDCRRLGIKVLPPDVNQSALDFAAVGEDIRFGLGAIRNVGTSVVEAIVASRTEKGPYSSFNDFLAKVPAAVCNKRVIESLAKAGAFDGLGHDRKGLVTVHEQAVDLVIDIKRHEAVGQDSLFGASTGPAGGPSSGDGFAITVPEGEWDKATRLAFEREMLGLYVSGHPLDGTERVLEANRDLTIAGLLASGRKDGPVRVSGIVSNLQRKVTKQGDPWAIVNVEDHDGSIECLVFPKSYLLYGQALAEDQVVSVRGRINLRDETTSLYAEGGHRPRHRRGGRRRARGDHGGGEPGDAAARPGAQAHPRRPSRPLPGASPPAAASGGEGRPARPDLVPGRAGTGLLRRRQIAAGTELGQQNLTAGPHGRGSGSSLCIARPADALEVPVDEPSELPELPPDLTLTGDGLVLREWTEEDLATLVELFDDPDIASRTPLASPFDLVAARDYLDRGRRARAERQRVQLAITTDGLRAKGEIQLNLARSTISYAVGSAYRGGWRRGRSG
jgi:DNA polymerase-3 subunit alpha